MKVAILRKDMGEGEKRVWDALFTKCSPYLGILIKRTTEADGGEGEASIASLETSRSNLTEQF